MSPTPKLDRWFSRVSSRIRLGYRDRAPKIFGLIVCSVFVACSVLIGASLLSPPRPPPLLAQRGPVVDTNLVGGYAFTYPRTCTIEDGDTRRCPAAGPASGPERGGPTPDKRAGTSSPRSNSPAASEPAEPSRGPSPEPSPKPSPKPSPEPSPKPSPKPSPEPLSPEEAAQHVIDVVDGGVAADEVTGGIVGEVQHKIDDALHELYDHDDLSRALAKVAELQAKVTEALEHGDITTEARARAINDALDEFAAALEASV